ncbi:MAG: glutamyl-tRNA reductase [Flavobacteriaceae bacterium]|nr:glutamyl-tRNA reductase [Flavobacteriaceae bacterium]
MQIQATSFFIIGISYKNADAEIRGNYSLDPKSKLSLLTKAKESGLESVMAISTCNRTEVIGLVNDPEILINLLCDTTNSSKEEFKKHSYTLSENEAMNHLFKVGSGLESQILGDFEIIGQLKHSAASSKKAGLLNTYLDRLISLVIRASKRIKTETSLSTGATSVSFASVQYICNNVEDVNNKNILLFGTGKIGRNTCENLIKQTKNSKITLINRTKDKAEKIAGKFNLKVEDISDLSNEISKADVLVVATGALETTVDKSLIKTKSPLLVLDLSIPKNVSNDVTELENVNLIHLDDLSKITDKTLESREKEIPKAIKIIESVIREFEEWIENRKFAPTIRALKSKLTSFKKLELENLKKKKNDFNFEHAELISDNLIQKITNHFANHLINENIASNKSEELIKKVFNLEKTL